VTIRREFGYSMPYDSMVGYWMGVSTVYRPDGSYWNSVVSRVAMYWKRKDALLHYRQDEEQIDNVLGEDDPLASAIGAIIHHSFDLAVDGKACRSVHASEPMSVDGTETAPDVYLFHLTFPTGHFYNNQYFLGPHERRIIGPYVEPAPSTRANPDSKLAPPLGEIRAVVAQTFTRISYEVPRALIYELPAPRAKARKKRR
jgi:hypothetical protein